MIRALDPAERFIWLLDCISCANFVTLAELAGQPVDEETLRRGLDRLQANHPLLSARVVEADDGTVAFYREEGARIPLHVEERSENDWQAPIEAEFNARFDDPGRPLMRCNLLNLPDRSVLALTFHHAIADGRSAFVLLYDLLRFCLRGTDETTPQGVPPPLHSLFPPEFRWKDHPEKAAELAQQMMGELFRHGPPAELPFLCHEEPTRKPRLKQIRLDAAQGRQLLERCRAEGASVHGAICAAQLIATRNLFENEDARTLYLMCPADIRPYLTSDMGEQLSFCTTFLRSTYRIESQPAFWSLAREIGGDLKHRLQRGDGHLTYASLPLDQIGSSGPAFDAFAASVDQLPAGSNISNVGRMPTLEDCPEVISISGALCSLPRHLASLNVSSYKDELIINMTFDAAKFAPEMADLLAGNLQDLLGKASVERETGAAI
ncbi:MAG: condensation domain-containing protein [Novosphingobium sp.]|nr:hypothetical protein [Novosphingobium sp.]